MSLSSAKTLLKVLGILSIIGAIILFVLAVLLIVGGGMAVSNPELAAEVEAELETSVGVIGIGVGIGLTISAVFSLIEGILSLKAAKDSSKYKGAWVFSLINLVFSIFGVIMNITSDGETSTIISAFGSAVIALLTFLAANTIKKDAQNK